MTTLPRSLDQAQQQTSLGTAAARNLATTTKTEPQVQGTSPRWLLRVLPWVEAAGGVYRVNRRLSYAVGDGRLAFTSAGERVQVIPRKLAELPLLRGLDDDVTLAALAERFVQRAFQAGEVIAQAGEPIDQLLVIAHGKAHKISAARFGDETVLAVLADGDHVGAQALTAPRATWAFTVKAVTAGIVLSLPRKAFQRQVTQSAALRAQVERSKSTPRAPQDKHGQAAIEMSAGHHGEPELPRTFVDYETAPREYELSVAQTVLRVHTRVADLYNQPMNQVQEQLRLTIDALRERQESELINNPEFGLLHNADLQQRLQTRSGPPTPDDLDELLSRRRKSRYLLAHPRTIAAFGRQCNLRGLYPPTVELNGRQVFGWRGVPILPCDKIPITRSQTSSILVLRTGEKDQGVVGLHQTGIPDEVEPGLSVRFTGIDDKAVISYLVSAYYSVAPLVPDALGVLENVEIGR